MKPARQNVSVLFCECAYTDLLASENRALVHARLAAHPGPALILDDLCGRVAQRDGQLQAFVRDAAHLVVAACYPRSIRWLLRQAGVAPVDPLPQFLNLRGLSVQALGTALAEALGEAGADADPPPAGPRTLLREPPQADPPRHWFPVIDADRCTNCRQCRDFCLFGVYDTDAQGRVRVVAPANCKDQCPACARLCPQVAILFPKLAECSPISGEAGVEAPGKVRLSRDALFGDQPLEGLRARRRPALLKIPPSGGEPPEVPS